MRQLISASYPDSRGKLVLGADAYRHLAQVLRRGAGDPVEVRLPSGALVRMRVEAVSRKDRTVTLAGDPGAADAAIPVGSRGPALPRVVLLQWVIKGQKMDQAVRQATECGAELIIPVLGERCVSSGAGESEGAKAARWERIVREAREQSGSAVCTEVSRAAPPAEAVARWLGLAAGWRSVALALDEAPLARKTLHEYLGTDPELTALAVGPEGGMTEGELALLESAGFVRVHFRTNILRAETAAVYGIAAVQSALTELTSWRLKESSS